MKVRVVISFHDASNFTLIHKVGDVIDVSEERAQKLIDLGLVKKVVARKAEPVPEVAEDKAEKPVEEEKPEQVEEPKTETKKVEPKRSRRNRK